MNREFDQALKVYLKIRKGDVFKLVTEHALFHAVQVGVSCVSCVMIVMLHVMCDV